MGIEGEQGQLLRCEKNDPYLIFLSSDVFTTAPRDLCRYTDKCGARAFYRAGSSAGDVGEMRLLDAVDCPKEIKRKRVNRGLYKGHLFHVCRKRVFLQRTLS